MTNSLAHRLGAPVTLASLDDRLEEDAHNAIEARIRSRTGRVKSGAW